MKNWLLLLPFLFLPFMGHAQVVGPGFVDYVTSAPSGSCSSNAHQRNVMGLGTVYTCQSGTWAQISGGGGGCAQGTCVVNAPTSDQTITGAHALILSNSASHLYVGSSSPFLNGTTAQAAFGPGESVLDPFFQNGPFNTTIETTGLFTTGSQNINIFSRAQSNGGNNVDLVSIWGLSLFNPTVADTTNSVSIAVEGDAAAQPTGGQTFGTVVGGFFDAANIGAGTVTDLIAGDFEPEPGLNVGPIINSTGILIDNFSNIGTNNYALHILNQATASATTWAIKVDGGKNDLGPQATTIGSVLTSTNCADQHAPAVCGTAASGAVAVPTGVNPTLVINTTKVTATSRIFLGIDETLTIPSTTCNTTLSTLVQPVVTARSAGTSFTIQIGATLAANPACVSYFIVN